MISTQDLHIQEEIRPLFDLTYNNYSGKEVTDILGSTLGSTEAILARQQLLKGFIANNEILKDYSYYRYNLAEIYDFWQTIFVGSVSSGSLRMQLLFSQKAREQKRGKLILMVRLFYAIEKNYLCKIDANAFPPAYAAELNAMKTFFAGFNLERYETAFNKNKFRVRHIVELLLLMTEKIGNGQAEAFWKRWFLFEAYLSISTGIATHGFVFPVFDDTRFSLQQFYHPVLKHPVKNDFTAQQQVVLLTGPNMSGKSTLLKAVSICVYLAHAGLAVPAAKAIMPFYNTIAVAINLTDSIVSGYSHFMSEIITLKNVLKAAGSNEKCFAVFDELFRGTNIEDALEISTATLNGLTRFPNSLFFISTHLHQLKEMPAIKDHTIATCYIDCQLNNNVPAFTYLLKEGWSDLKLGRILFEKEGLNKMLNR